MMILGLPYSVWIGMLAAIGVLLWLTPSKKKPKEPEMTREEFNSYIESAVGDMTEMRWVRARVTPNEVTEMLDKIEEAKITVMYQFFVRDGNYDMFFRCRKTQQEELKKVLDLK